MGCSYLSDRALEGLRSYEYKPAGYTILDKLHTPFWNGESLIERSPRFARAALGRRFRRRRR
jgi:hypothetical protein